VEQFGRQHGAQVSLAEAAAMPVAGEVGSDEQSPAPGDQRGGVDRAAHQPQPVSQGEDEVEQRAPVGIVGRAAQQQVACGVEIVRIGRHRAWPRIAVALVAEPPERHRHVRPGRIIGWEQVEQGGRHLDRFVTVGASGADRYRIRRVQLLGGQ